MQIKDILKWNHRMSAVYALGVWTTICSFGYLKYTGQFDQALQKAKEEEIEQKENTVVYTTAHTKSIIVYKKDFVPYSTRIHNFLTTRKESDADRPDEADNTSSRV